ncbi:high mobility group B protein 3-like [Pseudomyrmex gracilis]|uniref:high mobility group B protein 3-like n=1 Tax=Pseudomyrmex gracilis TaxID=219809 RepID=UPI00099589D6|nr:high mobility group B protein 3-like [Pseudomyrmex gracilis]
MEDNRKRENGNEATGDGRNDGFAKQQERCCDNQYQLTESLSGRKLRGSSRSRSRSVSRRKKQRRSANAFLNFMQDFRQTNNKLKNKDLFRLGGQIWRQMSAADKMPYVKAAKLAAQEQKSQQQTDTSGGQQNKSTNGNSSKKFENPRKDKKRREKRRSSSKTDISDTESDSRSGTGASMTSENDASDLSS